jgi:DNA-binding transcriptional MerR regulator
MAEAPTPVEIPNRASFKAAEVCDLVKVQPYVLRTWEAEFPELGFAKTEGGPRMYRRADVEQVLRIKHLLLVEGLTLAGAKRKLEEQSSPAVPTAIAVEEPLGQRTRERLVEVKRGLQSIQELLSGRSDFRLTPPQPAALASSPDAAAGPAKKAKPVKTADAEASTAAVRRRR